ncbi:3-hydroxyisobutyrate dehydrogenase [Georgenia soli]|uniref:3-hydroxyisobutyrate dehydrogenase n=1 Tax=Georgenia soli TaxID=638953 RepID=A0A2A9F3Q4_9MICO|nr:NAD(P)-dependent oxidoreductase [Georgenia soli]PFG45085.1 3-hydroxyisobutyrate dehydrogenase [Georgenia soli]
MDIGVIGMGNMGQHMARRLVEAGHRVLGFDPRPDIRDRLREIGAAPAESAADLTTRSQIVIVMVVNDAQAERAIWGPEGVAEGAHRDLVLVSMSSLSPSFVREVAERASGEFHVVDAPVSGGVEGAANGTLTIMVAGSDEAVAVVMPAFEAMGSPVVVGGTAGLGATMKVINQAMYFTALASAAEMVVAGAKAGLDPDTIVNVVSTSSGASWALQHRVPLAWRANYVSGGSLAIAHKDLGAAVKLADELGIAARVSTAAASLVADAMDVHEGAGDDPLIVEMVERLSAAPINAERQPR